MKELDPNMLMYPRNYNPFGRSWEKWAEIWCRWLLSIPSEFNPACDDTGKNSSQMQTDPNVWFLAGTFGNNIPVRRKCTVSRSKAILFPILEKEDSFSEDQDLRTREELAIRARDAMDRLVDLEAILDGKKLPNLKDYRVRSGFFDLIFPENGVYPVIPGLTTSICEGYWVFLRPLPAGTHNIYFTGEVFLPKSGSVTDQMKYYPVYRTIWKDIDKKSRFKIEVTYELEII